MPKGPNAVLLELGPMPNDLAGGPQSLWLEFSIDALCQIEEVLDLDPDEILARIGNTKRIGFNRALLWGALQAYHPGFDLKAAGELFRRPGAAKIAAKLLDAVRKAFPQEGDSEDDAAGAEAGGADRPPADPAGTGGPSDAPG